MTRRVPCYKRCKEIEYDCIHEKIIETGESGVNDEWVDTHHTDEYNRPGNGISTGIEALELKDEDENEAESDDSEEALDLEDIEDDQIMVKQVETVQESQILKTRTYDLHITRVSL